jgi:plasmid stabilization system protein ParE
VEAILASLEVLEIFPLAGRARPELGPGIRSTGYKRRVTILYRVRGRTVRVLSVLYGGREVRLDH